MKKTVYFLLHVPKCAGTTITGHFRAHLDQGYLRTPRLRGLKGVIGNFRGPQGTLDGLSAERLQRLNVLSGHSLSRSLARHFPGCEIREAVLLRDPVGYFVSFYNFHQFQHREYGYAEPPPFEVWYRGTRKNPISRFILNHYLEIGHPRIYAYSSAGRLALLERELAGFHFVAGYRHCDALVRAISRSLGVSEEVEPRNVSAPAALTPETLPPGLAQRILRDNALDQALYERWQHRLWDGAPSAAAPALPAGDHAAYFAADIGNVLRRRWRWNGNTGGKLRREARKLAGARRQPQA